ncbi:hypothetical protein MRX96_006997 [Rhipicephalus microplus]
MESALYRNIGNHYRAHPRGKPAGSDTANKASLIRRDVSDSYIYDTETKIQAKVSHLHLPFHGYHGSS